MSRSVKKGPYVQPVLLKRIQEMNAAGEKKIIKTWSRASIIFPDFVGHTGVCHRGYGRAQARRVCPHQNLQGTFRFQNHEIMAERSV